DAEVEHLFGLRIKLGMRRQRAGVIQASAEGELAASFQCFWIQFPGQTLFSKSKQPAAQRIHADIGGRVHAVVRAVQPAARNLSPKYAEQRSAGGSLFHGLARTNIAAAEPHAIFVETEPANHAIAVEPVAVGKLSNLKASRPVEVVRASHEPRNASFDLLN